MLFLLIWFIVGLLLLSQFMPVSFMSSPWGLIFTQLVLLLLPMFVWARVQGDKLSLFMPREKLGAKNILLLVLFTYLILPATMALSAITALFVNNYVPQVIAELVDYPLWLMLLAMAVTPGVVEEVVFRGYLQSKHKRRTIHGAAFLNGLFFGIIHLNLHQFFYAFVLGVVFVYLVHHTRSVWAGIIPHFLFNATSVVIGRWALNFEIPDIMEAEQAATGIPGVSAEVAGIIVITGLALLLMPLTVSVYRTIVRHNGRRFATPPVMVDALPQGNTFESFESPEIPKAPETMGEMLLDYNGEEPNKKDATPPLFDIYAIAVVAVFTVFVLLTILG